MHRHGGNARPPIRLAARLALALAIASVFFAARAHAQDVPFRIDADAATVPAGVLRFGVSADFSYVDQLRQANGTRVPLGRRIGFDSTDNVVASAAVSITRLPISLEYGVTRWLTIGASAPLVRRRVEVSADTNARLLTPATPAHMRLTDPSALEGFTHTNIGDVDIMARIGLFDSFRRQRPLRLRIAAEGGVRLGAGPSRPSNSMIDPGAGDGQNDVIAAVYADAALGSRWSLSFAGSQTWQRPDRQTVVSSDSVYPSQQVHASVARDLGDIRAVMISPRYRLTRYIQLAASATQLTKTADIYTGATPADGWGLVAPPVGQYSLTRAALGIVFSTLPDGRAIWRWPVDLVFEHSRIVHSSGATIPDARVDRIGGRLYVKLF